ncbi:polyadenylate-binding protein-interacting protein 3 isoform X2 [Coffea arabica]|uniref:Polyadenylate-binding protein-interacting protein 3 isoform X2 n=1 Tax=Coffea arabica TaxID=13443 RepID=A0A6P6XF51_COFAR|nr:polyadenylate-binding protein-interacting protein 4-like isoform X2 [Coffea arabica]
MSLQQAVQPRSAANGFGRRRTEKDGGPRLDSKLQTVKANSSRSSSVGKEGGYASPSRERLVYVTTCLVGHQVEVQVVDGSAFSGILHATNAEKDFGIVLKMARLVRDGSRGQKNMTDSINKPPSKTLIIPAKELVQVIAKGVPVTRDGLGNELQRDKHQEILIDSFISQSRRAEMDRELERWVPEDDDPVCPELENIFDGHWDRGWDQFQANETLFGVKSTFNEELYTTKLEKGPQMKELEREALRIAREIEGEDTHDLHLAEERGLQLHEKFEVDEETKFSSVFRVVDDSGCDDILLDTHNNETFGGGYVSGIGKSFVDLASVNSSNGAQLSTRSSPLEEAHSAQSSTSREVHQSGSDDHFRQLSAGHLSKDSLNVGDSRAYENQFADHDAGNEMVPEEAQSSKPEDSRSSQRSKLESSDKGGLSANATAYAPSRVSSKNQEKASSNELSDVISSSMAHGTVQSVSSRVRPSSSASSSSDCGGGASASGGPGLSPSSSMGSLSSEKSTLNPHAKEFKLNPNAKSFIPSQTPLRPPSPVSDGSFYYPTSMAAIPNMHGMPVGIGIGPTFTSHQPVIFNPQAAPTPQPYFHPGGPQYGRQMMISHPQQVVYMPTTYNPEMPYKGREF